MNNKALLAAVLCMSAGLAVHNAYAQLPGLSSGLDASQGASAPQTTAPPETTAPQPGISQAAPSLAKPKGNSGHSTINTSHSLEQVMFKVSRAQVNREQMGDDYNGHGTKAIEYLKKAMEELRAAKEAH